MPHRRAVVFSFLCGAGAGALLLGGATACKSTAGGAPDAAPPALALPHTVPIAEAVCKLRSKDFSPDADVKVLLSATAPAFALFPRPPAGRDRQSPRMGADLELPADEGLPFGLHLRGKGLELWGQIDRTFTIRAAGPFALGKFAAALPTTTLRVIAASQVEVEVEANLGTSIEVIGDTLKSRGPCALFGIDQADFVPTAVIPGVAWKETPDALLQKDRAIPLTVLPLGEPVARLKPGPNDNRAVAVFAKDKDTGRSHIGWFGGPVLVHGWVATSDLIALPRPTGQTPKTASQEVPPPEPPFTHGTASCANEVSVVGQLGEARAIVGAVGNSVPFEVLERSGGWAQIRMKIAPLRLEPGTRLLVRESDLAACEKSGG